MPWHHKFQSWWNSLKHKKRNISKKISYIVTQRLRFQKLPFFIGDKISWKCQTSCSTTTWDAIPSSTKEEDDDDDDDDDNELLLRNGKLMNNDNPYFQLGPLSEILTIPNFCLTVNSIWICADPEFWVCRLKFAVVTLTTPQHH